MSDTWGRRKTHSIMAKERQMGAALVSDCNITNFQPFRQKSVKWLHTSMKPLRTILPEPPKSSTFAKANGRTAPRGTAA